MLKILKNKFHFYKYKTLIFSKRIVEFLSNIRLIILLIILFILIFLLPFKFPIPFINPGLQISSQFISVIISSLSSILGIALAIMLIGFELIYRTYSNYVKNIFFNNPKFKELIILYLSTILFGAITLITLDESTRSFNLLILNFYLFLLCLAILFSHTKSLIFAVVSTDTIKKLVKSLDNKSIKTRYPGQTNSPALLADYIDRIENDSLFVLGEAASNYLKNDNTTRAYTIVVEVTRKLLGLAKKQQI